MKRLMAGMFVAAWAAIAGAVEIPLDDAHWENVNPLGGDFVGGEYACRYRGTQWNTPSRDLPISSNIVLTAEFTPDGTDGGDYKTAAVALYEAPKRFWHLAFLETPSGTRTFELNELLDGTWCAQTQSMLEVNEQKGPWQPGVKYRMSIRMDGRGVEGVVTTADGQPVFRRRYRFTNRSVACGYPVLKGYAFRGTYSKVDVTWQGERPRPSAEADAAEAYAGPFWKTERDGDGRWNFVSPEGKSDFLAGCSTVNWHGDYNFKLGYCPYGRAVQKKYGTPEKWAKACAERLRSWGFSYATAGQEFYRNTDFSYSRIIAMGQEMAMGDGEFCILPCDGGPCTAFPNVFSPKWEAYCRYVAKKVCRPSRNDRRLVGWFIDNELSWWGDARKFRTPPARGLYDAAIGRPEGHSARLAAERLAKERGFDDPAKADLETRRAFVALCAERYFSVAAKAIREADPNHLVLGCRFAGINSSDPVVWEACGRHCDVLSVNLYPVADLTREAIYNGSGPKAPLCEELLAKVHERCGKPLMITEWSFSALDSGVPCLHGAGQRFLTQRERAKAVELFAKTMYGLPYMAGYLFFKWSDQPYYGRKSEKSENTNYGLVNANDEPYAEVTSVLKEIQTNGAKWRREPPPRGKCPARLAPGEHARQACRADAAPATFALNGDGTFVADNGLLRLAGKKGEKGLLVGGVARYTVTVRDYVRGRMDWTYAAEVEDVRGEAREGLAAFEVTFRGKSADVPFRFVERFYLPAGCKYFFAEHRYVENLSEKPLPIDEGFFRLVPTDCAGVRAADDGYVAPPKDGQPTPVPPTLWRPWFCGVWLTPSAYSGLASPRGTEVRIRFWQDANMHTDAVYALGRKIEIAPGGKYEFAERPYVLGAAAAGGHADWAEVFKDMRR